jgi:hypothetical protein
MRYEDPAFARFEGRRDDVLGVLIEPERRERRDPETVTHRLGGFTYW